TVVGPRYNGTPDGESHQAEPWVATPHLAEGVPATEAFALQVELQSPVALGVIQSPSHRLSVRKERPSQARIELAEKRGANNRDFVLEYQLGGDDFASGVLLSRGAEENFFLALVAPPQQVRSEQLVPREYIFVVDISGSMHGFPLDTTQRLIARLLGSLPAPDRLTVPRFSGSRTLP